MNSGQRPPKPQREFWRPRQSSLTRKIIWHGSTAFLVCGFIWASFATFQNEQNWKTELCLFLVIVYCWLCFIIIISINHCKYTGNIRN